MSIGLLLSESSSSFLSATTLSTTPSPRSVSASTPKAAYRSPANPLAETLRGLIYPSRALSFIVLRCRTAYLNAKYWATGSPYPHIYSDAFYTEELIVATRQSLVEFKDYCTAHDLPLTVVALPDKDQVYKTFADQADQRRPIQVLTNMLAELEIDYLDLLPVFLQWEDGPLYNMTPAGHLSAQGHRVAAQTIEKHFNML